LVTARTSWWSGIPSAASSHRWSDELAACHCAALAKPKELAAFLESYTD
jgi:hypothetical protein